LRAPEKRTAKIRLTPSRQWKLRPLTAQFLLQILPHKETTDSGLFLPDIAHNRQQGEKEKPAHALVIAVGPWRKAKNGYSILPEIKPGDKVLVSFYAGHKLTRSIGSRLRLCSIDDVLAVLQPQTKAERLDANREAILDAVFAPLEK
jgi:co-chaperonin GroES (HSP10)